MFLVFSIIVPVVTRARSPDARHGGLVLGGLT